MLHLVHYQVPAFSDFRHTLNYPPQQNKYLPDLTEKVYCCPAYSLKEFAYQFFLIYKLK